MGLPMSAAAKLSPKAPAAVIAELAVAPINRGAVTVLVVVALERFEPAEIARMAKSSERSASHWRAGKNLPGSLPMSHLRAHLPWLDGELRRLESMERDLHPDLQRELAVGHRQLSLKLFGGGTR